MPWFANCAVISTVSPGSAAEGEKLIPLSSKIGAMSIFDCETKTSPINMSINPSLSKSAKEGDAQLLLPRSISSSQISEFPLSPLYARKVCP